MTRSDLAGVNTHGLHSATWRNIRKALRKLGGRPLPSTNNHDSTLIELPTRARVTTGKAKDTDEQVRVAGLQQLLHEVQKARLDPILFLAVLDGVGCAWVTKPAEVSLLEQFIRINGARLDTEAAWRRTLTEFSRRFEGTTVAAEGTEGADAADATAPEPATPTAAVRPPETPPEAPAEAPTEPSGAHSFTVQDVIDAAGVAAGDRVRAKQYIYNRAPNLTGPIPELIAAGHIIRKPRTRFNERAALAVAELLAKAFVRTTTPAPEPEATESTVPEPAPEPTPPATDALPNIVPDGPRPAPVPEPAPPVEPDVKPEPAPEAAPAARPRGPAPKFDSVGEAIAFLCARQHTIPRFNHIDSLRVDLEATVLALGNIALADAHASMLTDEAAEHGKDS
jgi:hypothetical protein